MAIIKHSFTIVCDALGFRYPFKVLANVPQAAVIVAANTKGGCGKTTTVLILAGEYAAQGYRVHILDADPRRRAMKWAEAGTKPASITASEANAANMRVAIESASKGPMWC